MQNSSRAAKAFFFLAFPIPHYSDPRLCISPKVGVAAQQVAAFCTCSSENVFSDVPFGGHSIKSLKGKAEFVQRTEGEERFSVALSEGK